MSIWRDRCMGRSYPPPTNAPSMAASRSSSARRRSMTTPEPHASPTTARCVLILGAGHIGQAIALLLSEAGGYALQVADHNLPALQRVQALAGVATVYVPDAAALEAAVAGHHAVLNALPFHQAVGVATLCARLGVHYFDLTEDVSSTQAIRALAA